jgi:signal transduction histidine kinase
LKSFLTTPFFQFPRPWRLPGIIAVCLVAPLHSAELEYRLAAWWKPELESIDLRLASIKKEIRGLPQMPDMDARGTHGFHSNFTLDSESNWLRIDWDEPREIDAVALIPTRLTTQSGDMSNYGLPHRLRIEAGLPGRRDPVMLVEVTDSSLDNRRGEPLFIEFPATRVLWLRFVPFDLPTLPGKSVRFFSAAEALVFAGENNIAPQGKLSANFSIDGETGWNLRYLTDGKSPLGPPEVPGPPASLGWHADIASSRDSVTWAEIDLETLRHINAVRLIAAKGDSPVKGPGFGFPVRFQIETTATRQGDDSWRTVWESGPDPFQNPGYNAVTLSFPEVEARRVRLLIHEQHQPDILTAPRILLSEFEVLEGKTNRALGKPVRTPDEVASRSHDGRRVWSAAGLTDGHSSTGRLMPVRPWVQQLAKRFDLETEQRALLAQRSGILSQTRTAALTGSFAALAAVIIGLIIWQIRIRLAARRHIQALRRRIAGDLHDEVGSNLATISLLSEINSSQPGDGSAADISRLARESSLSLREIIDFTLVPKRVRKPLPERLREIADVMLRGIAWDFTESGSLDLDLEKRRSLVFFFKEALHNIIRHAEASHVELQLEVGGGSAVLRVSDDGVGLPAGADSADCLRTLKQRAEALDGRLDVRSSAGHGTRLELTFPIRTTRKP